MLRNEIVHGNEEFAFKNCTNLYVKKHGFSIFFSIAFNITDYSDFFFYKENIVLSIKRYIIFSRVWVADRVGVGGS